MENLNLEDVAAIAKSGALEKFTDLMHKLAGPLFEEVGLMMAEKVREYRVKNLVKVFQKAKKILGEAGLPENAVPPRIFLPILDSSSVENDESLQELWAGLLASASEKSDDLSPAFVETLKQLTPQQAKTLNELYEVCTEQNNALLGKPEFIAERLFPDRDQSVYRLTMNAFERLGILVKIYDLQKKSLPYLDIQQYIVTSADWNRTEGWADKSEDILPELTYSLAFTEYGLQFIRVCRGPKQAS